MQKEALRQQPSNIFEGMVSLRAIIESRLNGDSDRAIESVWFACEKQKSQQKLYAWLSHRAKELSFSLEAVPMAQIEERAIGTSHGGVLAFCKERSIPLFSKEVLEKKPRGFFALLDGIEDPYNFGYALRSLYAAGVDAILLPERNWLSAAGVVCRASAGASERFSFYRYEDAKSLCDIFHACNYRILCADIDRSVSVYDADLSLPLLMIVGGEKRGIGKAFLQEADQIVRLEYARKFDAALSAASASTILAYEIFQRNR